MFYDNYYFLCKQKGISLSKAAEDIGLNRSVVSKWKHTGFHPRYEILVKLADYFDVTVDYLLGRVTENKKCISSELSAELQELITVAADLPPEKIKTLTQVAESMKN